MSAHDPKVVTDNFVRTFRIEFDTSSVDCARSDGVACDLGVTMQAALQFTQTCVDCVYDPDALRICE